MSLPHGLLGLLTEGPASGYDLTRRFAAELGQVWPAGHPQIYSELSKLARDGFIEVESQGPRGRKAYRITEAGLVEVRRWLVEDEVDHTLRVEVGLRSFFYHLVEPADLDRHLAAEHRHYAELADRFRGYAEAKDRGDFGDSPRTKSLRLAVEAGVRLYQALADWAAWAREHPPLGERSIRSRNPGLPPSPADDGSKPTSADGAGPGRH